MRIARSGAMMSATSPGNSRFALAVPWNGFKVCSTFAGCGGSSLGYRMAGFRVLWANEFVDAAREVYECNARPGTIVDGRDVRDVKPEEVLAAIGLRAGELDVLDRWQARAALGQGQEVQRHGAAHRRPVLRIRAHARRHQAARLRRRERLGSREGRRQGIFPRDTARAEAARLQGAQPHARRAMARRSADAPAPDLLR